MSFNETTIFVKSFFGWGAEDDDFANRLRKSGYQIGARDNVTGRCCHEDNLTF